VELETEAVVARDPVRVPGCRSPSWATVRAKQIPMVFLTSNNTRELSEALKASLPLPLHRLPERGARSATSSSRGYRASPARWPSRSAPSGPVPSHDGPEEGTLGRRNPGLGQRTLVVLGRSEIGDEDAAETLHILLKYQTDIEPRPTKELLGRPKTGA